MGILFAVFLPLSWKPLFIMFIDVHSGTSIISDFCNNGRGGIWQSWSNVSINGPITATIQCTNCELGFFKWSCELLYMTILTNDGIKPVKSVGGPSLWILLRDYWEIMNWSMANIDQRLIHIDLRSCPTSAYVCLRQLPWGSSKTFHM